ncbi:hypothetical protein QJQ45_022265, partial [Haematococcus lacustris]
ESTKAGQAAEPIQPTKDKGKAEGKAAQTKPAPRPARQLDRDCNAALNMQRIGESRPSTVVRPDRLAIVDEFCTTRVSSTVHAPLPRDWPRPPDWVPRPGQVIQRLVLRLGTRSRPGDPVAGAPSLAPAACQARAGSDIMSRHGAIRCLTRDTNPCPASSALGRVCSGPWSCAAGRALRSPIMYEENTTASYPAAESSVLLPCKARAAPQPGRWVDRDCIAALDMQRIGDSKGARWCCAVAPRKPPQAPRNSQAATPAAASEPGPSTPPPAKRSKRTEAEPAAEPTKGKGQGKGKAAKAKPAPQPGRWLDRDCNAALNMQRIGESRWRPLELCYWPDQGALPAKGKEYPGLGYKRLRDKPPTAQQQQQQPAEAQKGCSPLSAQDPGDTAACLHRKSKIAIPFLSKRVTLLSLRAFVQQHYTRGCTTNEDAVKALARTYLCSTADTNAAFAAKQLSLLLILLLSGTSLADANCNRSGASGSGQQDCDDEGQGDEEVQAYLEQCFGASHFASMRAALSQPPKHTCLRVNTLVSSVEEVMQVIQDASKSVAKEEQQRAYQAGRSLVSSSPQRHPLVPCALLLPGCGPWPVDYSPAAGRELVISRKAAESVLRGAPVFVPGVLACSAGLKPDDLVAVTVAVELPGSIRCGVTRGAICHPPSSLSLSPPHCSPSPADSSDASGSSTVLALDMFKQERGVAVVMEQPVYTMPSVPEGLQGRVMLQNLASIVAGLALRPRPGARVLDMCAAPGGKATLLAQLMGDQGTVVALDRTQAKPNAYLQPHAHMSVTLELLHATLWLQVDEIHALAKELHLNCITAFRQDATKAVRRSTQQEPGQGCASQGPTSPRGSAHTGNGRHQQMQDAGLELEQQQSSGSCDTGHGSPAEQFGQRTDNQPTGLACCQADEGGSTPGQLKCQQRAERKQAGRLARGHALKPDKSRPALRASPPEFEPESFDCVLLDAPCSALGLRPRLHQGATLQYLRQCGVYTRKLLDTAVLLLRPGGRLVFSTCTISPWENEVSVRHVLDRYAGSMQLVAAEPRVGGPGLVGGLAGSLIAAAKDQVQPTATAGRRDGSSALGVTDAPEPAGPGHNVVSPMPSDCWEQAVRQGHGPGACAAVGLAADAREVVVEVGRQAVSGEAWDEVWLTKEEAALVQRFDPAGQQDSIGFFIAAFEKIA